MPFSASCRPVFVLSNGVLTFVVCHVVDFCDFFKVGQICIERVPLHGFLPVSRTPRHAYRCAASLAGFPLACQSCSILRSLVYSYVFAGNSQNCKIIFIIFIKHSNSDKLGITTDSIFIL